MASCFRFLCAAAFALGLGACSQPAVKGEDLASGSLLSIGKEHLVMQGERHVMFVSVDESDKKTLAAQLKQGEKITLVGQKEVVVEESPGHTKTSAEVLAIRKEDGTLIALNP